MKENNKNQTNGSKTKGTRGWPSCLIDSEALKKSLTIRNRSFKWLWTGDGPGRIDMKTGMRVEQGKPISVRTIFKIASRLGCEPLTLVSDPDAQMIVETARGRSEITDREGLWGGNPSRGYLIEEWLLRNGMYSDPQDFHFNTDIHHQVSHAEFISVDLYNPNERIEILALEWSSVKTVATKSSFHDLINASARHARVPICDHEKQAISLDTEPLVYVHDDVETNKGMTQILGEIFEKIPKNSGTQGTLPKISELEAHENTKSEVNEKLKALASENIQILDTSLSTDLVLTLDDNQEVFASFAKPLLVLAPSTLIDVEVTYPRLSLVFGLQPS